MRAWDRPPLELQLGSTAAAAATTAHRCALSSSTAELRTHPGLTACRQVQEHYRGTIRSGFVSFSDEDDPEVLDRLQQQARPSTTPSAPPWCGSSPLTLSQMLHNPLICRR